jgi:hypothetical protein
VRKKGVNFKTGSKYKVKQSGAVSVSWPRHLSERSKGIYVCRIERKGRQIYVRSLVNGLF